MADQAKKPRKIKDLKARLGKTIAPNTQGGGQAVPAPNVAGAAPGAQAPAGGGVVAPPGGRPGGVPAPGIRPGAPRGVAPPPFGQPAAQQQPARSADPFAAHAPVAAGPQEVRLVIDEKPVADAEVGRKARGRFFIIAGAFLAIGLVVGYGAGSMMSDRNLYNLAVRDGKDIYQTVRDASETVTKAQRYVDAAVAKARGGGGRTSEVDFQAIEALRALEKPLDAGTFSRRRYNAFKPETVDALFEYYNNVNLLWEKFETLAARTLPEAARRRLSEAIENSQNVASPTGCIPSLQDEQFRCGLVHVRVPEDGDGTKVMARTTRTSSHEVEKVVYAGQDLSETPDNYVIILDPQRSVGVLGEQANEFAQYSALISEIKQLMDRTIEVQGRLERELGDIARLEEVMAF